MKRVIRKGLLCGLFLFVGLGGILAEPGYSYRPKRIDMIVYRLDFADGIQVYSLDMFRYNIKMAEGRLVFGVSTLQYPLVVIDGYGNGGQQLLVYMASGIGVGGIGYLAGSVWSPLRYLAVVGLVPMLSNSHIEYHVSRTFALTAGIRSDALIIKSGDGRQGVLFSPRLGIDWNAPTYRWNFYVTKSWFWEFNKSNEDRGCGIGVTLYVQ